MLQQENTCFAELRKCLSPLFNTEYLNMQFSVRTMCFLLEWKQDGTCRENLSTKEQFSTDHSMGNNLIYKAVYSPDNLSSLTIHTTFFMSILIHWLQSMAIHIYISKSLSFSYDSVMLNSNCYHTESCELHQDNNHLRKYFAGHNISVASTENL